MRNGFVVVILGILIRAVACKFCAHAAYVSGLNDKHILKVFGKTDIFQPQQLLCLLVLR